MADHYAPVTDAEIDEMRRWVAERPWLSEALDEDHAEAVRLPLYEVQRRWRYRSALRKLVLAARTPDQRREVARELGRAVGAGIITDAQGRRALKRLRGGR
ncbi:MAG: hypothetical protein ACHQWU_12220 [Gemmatimonadales bacterium]